MMREKLAPYFFFAILALLLYEGIRILSPFAGPIICAIAAGTMFYPLHSGLGRRFHKLNASVMAVLSDLIVLLFFIVPFGLLIWAVTNEMDTLIPATKEWVGHFMDWFRQHPPNQLPVIRLLPQAIKNHLDLHSVAVQERLASTGNYVLGLAASSGTTLAGHTFALILDVIIFLLVLFFVFRDGPELLGKSLSLFPLDSASRQRIHDRLRVTMAGVVRGTFLTGLLQGICSMIGFLIVGTPGAILLGFLTALATFIPSVGTALIWAPVSLLYFLSGHHFKGLFVVLWGIFIVGVTDNLARPYLVGTKAEMPFLWLFFALLGGIEVFGPLGIILGPLLFGLIAVFLELYEEQYLSRGH